MHILKAFTLYIPFLLLTAATSLPSPSPSAKGCSHPDLLKRGGSLSCFRPPADHPDDHLGGLPEDTPRRARSGPPLAGYAFVCKTPAATVRYKLDCYCDTARAIRCDKRIAFIRETFRDLHLASARAAWIESRILQRLENEAGRVCRCGRALHAPINPYKDQRGPSQDPQPEPSVSSSA